MGEKYLSPFLTFHGSSAFWTTPACWLQPVAAVSLFLYAVYSWKKKKKIFLIIFFLKKKKEI